mgnify:CR=1 FL=1
MQASVETLGNLERRVTFSLPADRLETAGERREEALLLRLGRNELEHVPSCGQQRFGSRALRGFLLRRAEQPVTLDGEPGVHDLVVQTATKDEGGSPAS